MTNSDNPLYRQKVWEKEYNERLNLPSSKTFFPSRALKTFLAEFNPVNRQSALDLGSGNGRNSIFLAQEGYDNVVGIEFVEGAVQQANLKKEEFGLDKRIQFIHESLGRKIDFTDESFDLIVDMMVMHSMIKEDRENLVKEIIRLLKPGGYLVFYTIAVESEAAKVLMEKNPGPEEHSYRFEVEEDVVTEKAFTKEELVEMFEGLNLKTLELKEEFTPAFGDVYKRGYYYGVFQKSLTNS